MLPSIGKCLFVCLTMLCAVSCVSAARNFYIDGKVFDATTKQPLKAVKVALLHVESGTTMELPDIKVSEIVLTDLSGGFAFKVCAKRGVLLEVLLEEGKASEKYTVPLDKIKKGKLRVEIRVIGGRSEVRWNNEGWVQWKK